MRRINESFTRVFMPSVLKTSLFPALVTALLIVLIAASTAAQDAPTVTPLPPVDLGQVTGLAQSVSVDGFPQLGNPDAPVQVREYCGFDVSACGAFRVTVFNALLERIQSGDVFYTFVPMFGGGDIPNGEGAAKVAVCAAEQGVFWTLSDTLYDWQAQLGSDALEPNHMQTEIDALPIDHDKWNECIQSSRPERILGGAQIDAQAQVSFAVSSLPFVTVNGVPSLTDAQSLIATINFELAQPRQEATPDAESTADPMATLEPLMGQYIEPPLDIQLPAGWRQGYDTVVLQDVDSNFRGVPLAVYTGPVSGGTGTIVLLWGFPNLVVGNPFLGEATPDLWSDGLRLLRLAIVEEGCNVGTDLRREFSIGGQTAVGTQFSAVDCPQLPDTRGWFAGVQQQGINFVFYVYTDPLEAMNTAQPELQAIMDTVAFREIPVVTPQP
jgi:protein-disulfide isomerase